MTTKTQRLKIQPRSKVPAEQTWDLSDLAKDIDHWESKIKKFPSQEEIVANINSKFYGKLHTSPELLFKALQYRDQLFRELGNLYTYAALRNTEDVGDDVTSSAENRVTSRYAQLQAAFAFLDPEIIAIPWISEKIHDAPLKEYSFPISELLRVQKHVLSEAEEALIAKLNEPLAKFSEIHSKWDNVDLTFPSVVDEQGKEHVVSHSRLVVNLSSPDRVLRKNTFLSFYEEIRKWRNTIAANFYAHLLNGSIQAKVRKYPSFLASQLDGDNIPASVYNKLIASTRSQLHLLHRSMKLRKNVLKINKVTPYDRYVSLANVPVQKFTWQKAVQLVLASLEPLGTEYVDIARKGLTVERWADYAENQGKRAGAFSSGTYDSKPYMLLNWSGTLEDMFTLAHELGHSMHSYYSNKSQPYHLSHYTIFVAEVASTLNEALLSQYILNSMPGSDLAKAVVSYRINNFEATVLRQTLFACFERDVSALVDEGVPLTPDLIDSTYLKLIQEWYGPSSEATPEIASEWMRIPHFYSTFYVYKYATSYCASSALSKLLIQTPSKGQDKIMKLLCTGGSTSPLKTLLNADIDFLKPDTVDAAFTVYENNLNEAEQYFTHQR